MDRNVIETIRRNLVEPEHVAKLLGLEYRSVTKSQGFIPCPWHNENTPSCSLSYCSDDMLRAHCFGCKEGGDVFSLVAAVYDLDVNDDFRRVVTIAADFASVDVGSERRGERVPAPAPKPRRTPPPAVIRQDDAKFNAILQPIFHMCRLADSDGAAYLLSRGLLEQALADGWGCLPPEEQQAPIIRLLRANFSTDDLLTSQIFWRDRVGAVRFKYADFRLLIPWRAPDGCIDTLQRRLLREKTDADPDSYVMTRGRRATWPYGIERLSPSVHTIAFVEGAMDVLAMRELCARHKLDRTPLGLPGVHSWQNNATEWARLAAGRNAIVALDNDDTGRRAAGSIRQSLAENGALSARAKIPAKGKDWAELVKCGGIGTAKEGAAA